MDDLGVLVVVVGGWFFGVSILFGCQLLWLVGFIVRLGSDDFSGSLFFFFLSLLCLRFISLFFFFSKKYALFSGSHVLFTGPTSTLLRKKN